MADANVTTKELEIQATQSLLDSHEAMARYSEVWAQLWERYGEPTYAQESRDQFALYRGMAQRCRTLLASQKEKAR